MPTGKVPTINQEGRRQQFKAAAAADYGDLIQTPSGLVGLILGVGGPNPDSTINPGPSIEVGDPIACMVTGVASCPNDGTNRVAGTVVGWDAVAKTLTAGAAGTFDIGTVVETSDASMVAVDLNTGLNVL